MEVIEDVVWLFGLFVCVCFVGLVVCLFGCLVVFVACLFVCCS